MPELSLQTLTLTKTWLEILGIFAALVFFLYKIAAGWMIPNLKLSVVVDRVPTDRGNNKDFLVVKVKLEKGSTDGVRLHLVEVRVTPIASETPASRTIRIDKARRLQVQKDNVSWNLPVDSTPLNLAPGDAMEFAHVIEVESGLSFDVEAIVVADRVWVRVTRQLAQWRSSVVSLPYREKAEG